MRLSATLLTVLLLLTAGVAPAAAGPADAAGADVPALSQHECTFPFSATDATGTEVTIDAAPETVTTLGPSATQTMWEIGAREQVVGVDQYSAYLDGAESRTNVSAAGRGYSTEAVVGTEADLVLAANVVSNDTVSQLRAAGMTVFKFEGATSIEDVREKTTLIGALTGNCEGAARTNKWMMQNVETAREMTSGDDARPSVLVPLGSGFVVGGETFIDSVVTAAGGENVAARNYTGYPQLSDELVLELNPEVLVLQPWMSATGLATQEPYASTAAGEANATAVVNANYLNQPAPRSVVYATRNLTEAFHPDAYASAEWTARGEVTLETETATPTQTDAMTDTATEPMETETTSTDAPGFGTGAAIAALGAGAALLARRE